jgi:hypothetical protein
VFYYLSEQSVIGATERWFKQVAKPLNDDGEQCAPFLLRDRSIEQI